MLKYKPETNHTHEVNDLAGYRNVVINKRIVAIEVNEEFDEHERILSGSKRELEIKQHLASIVAVELVNNKLMAINQCFNQETLKPRFYAKVNIAHPDIKNY